MVIKDTFNLHVCNYCVELGGCVCGRYSGSPYLLLILIYASF